MTNKYSRLKPKIKPLPIIIMVIMVIVFIIAILLLRPSASKNFQNAFNNAGANLPSDHVFVEISYKEYQKKQEKEENFVVFIGNPYDQGSPGEVEYYNKYFKLENVKEKLKAIYYLNSSKLSEEQTQALTALLLQSEGLQTPQLLYYHEGKLLYSRNDTTYTAVSAKPTGQIQAFFRAVYNKL